MNIIIYLIAMLLMLAAHWVMVQRVFSVERHINKLRDSILTHKFVHETLPVVMDQKATSQPVHYRFQIKGPPQINKYTKDLLTA